VTFYVRGTSRLPPMCAKACQEETNLWILRCSEELYLIEKKMSRFELDVGQDEFDIAEAVVVIDLGLIGNIEEFVLKQLFL